MSSVIMLNVNNTKGRNLAFYTECRFAKCRYVEARFAYSHGATN